MRIVALTLRKAQAVWGKYRRRVHDSKSGVQRSTSAEMDRQLKKVRAAWKQLMADFRNEVGVVKLPVDPALTERHLENCRVLPHREALLQQMKTGGIVAEVGVETGGFSREILDICRPSQLHLIDLDLRRFDIRGKFESEIHVGQVHLHEGDSPRVLTRFTPHFFDVIYIDGDHTYYGVKRDIEVARTKIKDDGFLIFNDYTYWSPAEGMRYGVIRAVNELCIEEDWEMVYFALGPYMYCDVALRRRRA